jgi:hypothetical protein
MADEPNVQSGNVLAGQPPEEHRGYLEIIKDDIEIGKEFTEGTGSPAKIIYYCKNCEKLIAPNRIGKKLSFKCEECKSENVAFGTEQSIYSFYNIKTPEKTK